MPARYRTLLWVIFITLSAGLFYKQFNAGFNVETNILRLLPDTEVDPFAEQAFKQFSDQNFKQIMIGLKASNTVDILPLAQSLINQLHQTQLIEQFNTQISDNEQEAIAELIFAHRFHLLSDTDRQLLLTGNTESFIEHSQRIIYSPVSGQLLQLIPQDPLLLSYRYLQQSFSGRVTGSSKTQIVDGLLMVKEADHQLVVMSALLKESPFDTNNQQQINSLLDDFAARHPDIEVLTTGALFYAHYAATSARLEISTIGVGSLLGVIFLLVLTFRSMAPLFMTLISLAVGVFVAFTLVHFIFDSIHILTLVFGASLVGVAVDYAFHYFASAILHRRPLPHIIVAILMGLISSVVGYIALYMAPFPGLQQMALFCITGLISAFLTVTLLFDAFHYKVSAPTTFLSLLTRHQSLSQKFSHPNLIFALLILPVFAGSLLLSADQENDNIRQLQAAPQKLLAQEAELTQRVAAPATNQFFLVRANSDEQLLQLLNQFNDDLERLVKNNAISHYAHLGQFVPAYSQQNADYRLIGEHLAQSKLAPLFEIGILNHNSYQALINNYHANANNYLELSDWLTSPIGQRLSYLSLGTIEGHSAAIISLSNIQNLDALEQLAATHADLYFINKVDKVSELFSSYRMLATYMLLIACLVIFTLLLFKYPLFIACHVILAPLIAASVAIIFTTLISGSFNLFSTLALFLVLGIGIDYGLFYAEAKARSIYINLAVTLSAATTLLSFGLLSLSETPAIHTFGLTMLTGILTVFLLSSIIGNRIYQFKGLSNG